MAIKVLTFGQICDIVGKSTIEFSHIKNTDELNLELKKQFPELSTINYSIAVNKKTTNSNVVLNENDTVALLPAFSGG